MKSKAILFVILALLVIQTIPIFSHGQTTANWDLQIEKPFLFIGEELNGTMEGPGDIFFQIYLVNRSTYVRTLIFSNTTPMSGNRSFIIEMSENWIRAGSYTVNLTYNGQTVAFQYLNIVYDYNYLHEQEHSWIRRMFATLHNWLLGLEENIDWETTRQDRTETIDLGQTVFITGGAMLFTYFVIYPRFRAWGELNGRKGPGRGRGGGIRGDINGFHDIKVKKTPPGRHANIKSASENLLALGISPSTIDCMVWDQTGSAKDGKMAGAFARSIKDISMIKNDVDTALDIFPHLFSMLGILAGVGGLLAFATNHLVTSIMLFFLMAFLLSYVFKRWSERKKFRECRSCGTVLYDDMKACPICGDTIGDDEK